MDNNSSDGIPQLLKDSGYIKLLPPSEINEFWETENIIDEKIEVYCIRMNKNIGGSGGFHEGIKKAYEKGYDWIWIMDDDAEPEKTALEEMMEYKNCKELVALTPLKVETNGEILYQH